MKDKNGVSWHAYRDETPGCPNRGRVWNVATRVEDGLRKVQHVGVCVHCGCEPVMIGSSLFEPEPRQGDGPTDVGEDCASDSSPGSSVSIVSASWGRWNGQDGLWIALPGGDHLVPQVVIVDGVAYKRMIFDA